MASPNPNPKSDDFLGIAIIPIAALLAKPGQLKVLNDWVRLHPREGKKEQVSGDLNMQVLWLCCCFCWC